MSISWWPWSCTPYGLFVFVHKSSPMLSILLSIEEEYEPLCNSWSPIAMYMEIVFMPLHLIALLVLQLFLIVVKLCPQSFFMSSSPPSLLSFTAASTCTNFYHTFQNRTCTKLLLQCKILEIMFPTSHLLPETASKQESYALFTSKLQSVPSWFQNVRPPMFLP